MDDAPTNSRAVLANFAWRAFIALNWPSAPKASGRGEPDRAKALGDSGGRVWETFKSDYELFQIDAEGRNVPLAPWASYGGRNPCTPGVDNRQKTIASFAPFADFNQPSFAADEPANPLVAENGAYTRYEIHFNATEFKAFADNGWSRGLNLPDASQPARFPVGSIAVKAAWRPLTSADPPSARSRAYVERAEIVDVAKTLAAGHVVCSESDVALVGLHIAIKTASRPQWIWSTFEQERAPRRRRARLASRTRATPASLMPISTPRSRSVAGRRWARPQHSRLAGRTRRSRTPLRCRSCAAIRSTRRSWR